MDIVEYFMKRRKWRNLCLRTNIVTPDKIELYKKTKLAHVESNVCTKSTFDNLLREAIREIAPEWWDDETKIILNRNVVCQKHRDGNKGHSWILWLGDFTGGALLFDDGTRIEDKRIWHKIDGQIPHWNEPHEGDKYGIVLYGSKSGLSKTSNINSRVQIRKANAEPTWINMTDEIRKDFIDDVAK